MTYISRSSEFAFPLKSSDFYFLLSKTFLFYWQGRIQVSYSVLWQLLLITVMNCCIFSNFPQVIVIRVCFCIIAFYINGSQWLFSELVETNNITWATTWQNKQSDCAPSEDSDQPGHPLNLIRVFAVCMKKAWVLSYPLSIQQKLWSDWTDAQADLSLRWVHVILLILSCYGSLHIFKKVCCLWDCFML